MQQSKCENAIQGMNTYMEENNMLEIKVHKSTNGPKILVIGVGGGGNNAVDRMIDSNLGGVAFASVNTDLDVLENCKADVKLQIGTKLLRGYGAGANPELGEAAAVENEEDIKALIEGNDMVIITCGMGGGTGTGAAPFIAKCCKDMDILTVGVVTTPFTFENTPRMKAAEAGIEKLKEQVDTLLVIPNDKLIGLSDKPLTLSDAFVMADSVLKYTIDGISNIVFNRGVVNIDFNDVKTTLKNKGIGHLGVGQVDADGSIIEAVKQAVNSPLLDTKIEGAANLLINTSGRVNIVALNDAISYIRELAGEKVNIIWGTVSAENFDEDKIVVTLIATGMPQEKDLKKEKEDKLFEQRVQSMKRDTLAQEKKAATIVKQKNVEVIRFDHEGKEGFIPREQPKAKKLDEIVMPPFLSEYIERVKK